MNAKLGFIPLWGYYLRNKGSLSTEHLWYHLLKRFLRKSTFYLILRGGVRMGQKKTNYCQDRSRLLPIRVQLI